MITSKCVLMSSLVLMQVWLGSTCWAPKLIATSMLARHGNRSPIKTYPLDPYKNFPWPGGFGALTPKGKQDMFEAGLIQADRYLSLVVRDEIGNGSCSFDRHKLLALSSHIKRCIISAEYFLDSFFEQQFSIEQIRDLIHVIPADEDEMLAVRGKLCRKYIDSLHSQLNPNDKDLKEIIDLQSDKGKKVMAYIQKHTGFTNISLANVAGLGDTLSVERENGLKLPNWTDPVYHKYIIPISMLAYQQAATSPYMSVRSGVLLKNMVQTLQDLTNGRSEQNIMLYAAHDITISGLLAKLDVANQTDSRPGYGARLVMELYQNRRLPSDIEIRIYYFMNYGVSDPQRIEIPHCKAPCSFEKFVKLVEPKFTWNYDKVCSD